MVKKGQTFGKYKIIRKLGSGGMADVYEAEDSSLGRSVALKLLPPEFARDKERVRRFQREVRSSASLNHPRIVTIFEVGSEGNIHFYSMPLLAGGDLGDRIRAGMKPREALEAAKQVAEALGYAHSRHFVHRDIKPENIRYDGQGHLVLTDFGIAKAMASVTRMTGTGMSLGTPFYMSPEQTKGSKDIDGRADLYSLGIVFYEMLTGKVPYGGESSIAVGIKHLSEPLPLLEGDLQKLQGLLDRMLAKGPEQRFPNCEDLIKAIDETLKRKYLPPLDVPHRSVNEDVVSDGIDTLVSGYVAATSADEIQRTPTQSIPASNFKETRLSQDVWPTSPEREPSKLPWIFGGVAVVLLAFSVGMFFSGGDKPDSRGKAVDLAKPKQRVAQQRAGDNQVSGRSSLSIISSPTGARVMLDGKAVGTTPHQQEISGEFFELTLQLAGYDEHHESLFFAPGQALEKEIQLQRDPSAAVAKPIKNNHRHKPLAPELIAGTDHDLQPESEAKPESPIVVQDPPDKPIQQRQKDRAISGTEDTQQAGVLPTTVVEQTRPAQPSVADLLEKQIARLLVQANADYNAGRLTRPAKRNALEKLLRVRELDSGNQEATDLLYRAKSRLLEVLAGRDAMPTQSAMSNLLKLGATRAEIDALNDNVAAKISAAEKKAERKRLAENAATVETELQPSSPDPISVVVTKADPDKRKTAATFAANREHIPVVGENFRDDLLSGGKGPRLVVIPAGKFKLGDSDWKEVAKLRAREGVGKSKRYLELSRLAETSKPKYTVRLPRNFAMGIKEVSVLEFGKFVDASGYVQKVVTDHACYGLDAEEGTWFGFNGSWDRHNFPITKRNPVACVTWYDAQAYVKWLSKQTGLTYRLPSEAEWEYAARGGTRRNYPWGSRITRGHANCLGVEFLSDCKDDFPYTAPTGSFTASEFGLFDMAGNVWEWTADCWQSTYKVQNDAGVAFDRSDCRYRAFRGGSWNWSGNWMRTYARLKGKANSGLWDLGFRVVRDLEPPVPK